MVVRHILAAAIAFGLLIGSLSTAAGYVRSLEAKRIHAIAPKLFDLKNQGTEL